MSDTIRTYRVYLAAMLVARSFDQEVVEEQLLDEMDVLWSRLSKDEQAQVRRISAAVANGQIAQQDFIVAVVQDAARSTMYENRISESQSHTSAGWSNGVDMAA